MSGYIGRAPLSEAVQSRTKVVATAGQTVFNFSYQPGFVDVFLNGIKLESTIDYTATDGLTIVLTTPALVGQVFEAVGLSTFSLINGKINYNATSAPTTSDDESEGYRVGSMWIDTTNDEVYRCTDDTTGAAIWIGTTLEVSDLGSLALKNSVATGDIDNGAVTASKLAAGAAVPSQTGHSGKFLTTNGTSSSWGTAYNDYVDSASFSTSTGVLTLGRTGSLADITVDLDGKYAESSHTHSIANVTGLQTALDGKVDDSQVLTNVPSGALFTDTVYTHPATHTISEVTGLQAELDTLETDLNSININMDGGNANSVYTSTETAYDGGGA